MYIHINILIYLNVYYIINKIIYNICLWIVFFPVNIMIGWFLHVDGTVVHSFSLLCVNMLQCILLLMNIWEISKILLIQIILQHTFISRFSNAYVKSFFRDCTKEQNCWAMEYVSVQLYQVVPNCFAKWLH